MTLLPPISRIRDPPSGYFFHVQKSACAERVYVRTVRLTEWAFFHAQKLACAERVYVRTVRLTESTRGEHEGMHRSGEGGGALAMRPSG